MSESNNNSAGIGFFGLLAILFIGLKLTGYITWSWWLVTSPLWGGIAIIIVAFVIIAAAQILGMMRPKR